MREITEEELKEALAKDRAERIERARQDQENEDQELLDRLMKLPKLRLILEELTRKITDLEIKSIYNEDDE